MKNGFTPVVDGQVGVVQHTPRLRKQRLERSLSPSIFPRMFHVGEQLLSSQLSMNIVVEHVVAKFRASVKLPGSESRFRSSSDDVMRSLTSFKNSICRFVFYESDNNFIADFIDNC